MLSCVARGGEFKCVCLRAPIDRKYDAVSVSGIQSDILSGKRNAPGVRVFDLGHGSLYRAPVRQNGIRGFVREEAVHSVKIAECIFRDLNSDDLRIERRIALLSRRRRLS